MNPSIPIASPQDPALTSTGRTRFPLYLSTVLYWSSLYLYVPILAPYAEHQGATLKLVGFVVSAYGLGQLLLRLPLGIISDRVGQRKPFLTFGFIASCIAAIGFIIAPTPWFMVGARFFSGVSACAWVVFTVLFASYFPAHQTTKAMGSLSFCNSISIMVATYIGGLLADTYGWQAPFWGALGVALVGLVSVPLIREQAVVRHRTQSSWQRLRSVVRHRELLSVSGIATLGQFTFYATTFGFVPNYAVSIGATKTQLGILLLLATLSQSVSSLLSGSCVSRYLGARQAVVISHLIIAAATIIIPHLDTIGGVYATQILVGFGRGFMRPVLMALVIVRLPEEDRATAMGFYQAVYGAGMFIGPVIAGFIGSQSGYAGIFLSSGAVALLTAGIALRLPNKD